MQGMLMNVILSVATARPVAWSIPEILNSRRINRGPSQSKARATARTITCIAGTTSGPSEYMDTASGATPTCPLERVSRMCNLRCIRDWIICELSGRTAGRLGYIRSTGHCTAGTHQANRPQHSWQEGLSRDCTAGTLGRSHRCYCLLAAPQPVMTIGRMEQPEDSD